MHIDQYGIAIYDSQDIEKFLYQGKNNFLDKILVNGNDPEIIKYNQTCEQMGGNPLVIHQCLDLDISVFDSKLQKDWMMPEEYKILDIETFLVQHSNKAHYQRLMEELAEFRARNMLDLLRWLKYFVDTCRKENIVWGVGRGSSVSSYILYVIGVHKIDPIRYNLDWRDFLR
jgi:DNA polymerase III alpha subunit